VQASWVYVGCGLASYLLGAIPFGYLIGRARGVDIRSIGSGNIGATNVFRSVGKGWGILTFACDAVKGFAPVFFLPRLAAACASPSCGTDGLKVFCACLAVAGHNWPVYLRFKGGKGVATSAGALLGLAPAGLLLGFAVWIVAFLISRYVSLASLIAAAAVSGSAWLLYMKQGRLVPFTLTALAILVTWRHRGNIRRLAQGTENRFQFRRAGRRGVGEAPRAS